jgi:hypothetical protein
MVLQIDSLHLKFAQLTNHNFLRQPDFWINVAIGLGGAFIGYLAWREAGRAFKEAGKAKDAATAAKDAATEAAKAVKIQTVAIDLTEIIQKLDKFDMNITYQDARDSYNETNRKIRRLLAPYVKDENLKLKIGEIFGTLDQIKQNLISVRPFNVDKDVSSTGNNVYFAIEADFSILSGNLAEVCGIFEQYNL